MRDKQKFLIIEMLYQTHLVFLILHRKVTQKSGLKSKSNGVFTLSSFIFPLWQHYMYL